MIRVVTISPLPPEKSGEAPYTARLIQGLLQTRKAEVVAIGGVDAEELALPEGNVKTLNIWRGRSLRYPVTLLKQIRREHPHIVHVQFGPYGKIYGGIFGEVMLILLFLLRLVGIKTTMTLHSTWMPEQVAERIARYKRLRRVSFLAKPFFRLYMRLLDWGTDSVQVSTSSLNSALRRRFLREYGFKPERVFEIPHPCVQLEKNIDQAGAKKKLGLENREIVLMFGFIRPGKGFETALDAMAILRTKIPKIMLVIAGRPQGEEGERHLEELHIRRERNDLSDNVRFDTRFIPEDEVPLYFAASSILLIPYTESVGASGPIHNYAGYGVPIIASDIGYHNRESLGGNIVLFRAGDPDDLSENLDLVLNDNELAQRISQGQMQYARSESWEVASKRTIAYYRKTILGN